MCFSSGRPTAGNDGGFAAQCLVGRFFTQGDTWEELRNSTRVAVQAFLLRERRIHCVDERFRTERLIQYARYAELFGEDLKRSRIYIDLA